MRPATTLKMISHVTSAPAVLVTLASASAPASCEASAPTSIARSPMRVSTWPAIRLDAANAPPNEAATTATVKAEAVCS